MRENRKNKGRFLNSVLKNITVWALALTGLFFCSGILGCAPPAPPSPEFIIKSGSVLVSPEAFADELDLKLTAYPYDIKNQPLAYNSMVLDLVSILTDETVILARAKEKKIFLSEEDVALAESEFKKDYPQDSFEQMLLENAIPYPVWRNRLEKDMVIDKIVQLELVDVQEISPEDMVAFYSRIAGQPEDERHALDEAGLVKQLRMEKSQAFYDEWISGLKIKYPVEINQKALAVFLMKQE